MSMFICVFGAGGAFKKTSDSRNLKLSRVKEGPNLKSIFFRHYGTKDITIYCVEHLERTILRLVLLRI